MWKYRGLEVIYNANSPPFASESCSIIAQIQAHKDNGPKCQVSTGYEVHGVGRVTGDKHNEALDRSSMVMLSDSRRVENSPPTQFPVRHSWDPGNPLHRVCEVKLPAMALCFRSHRYVGKSWSCWARTRSTTIRDRWWSSARTASTRSSLQSRRPRPSRASSTLITQVCAPFPQLYPKGIKVKNQLPAPLIRLFAMLALAQPAFGAVLEFLSLTILNPCTQRVLFSSSCS